MSALEPAALRARLLALPHFARMKVLAQLEEVLARGAHEFWPLWAHDGQDAPGGDWRVWLIRAGRGFGKTRAGAEWVSEVARCNGEARIALVAATLAEGRRVMVEGESGLLAVARGHEPVIWHPSRDELVFASGARAFLFSADAPEALRGPQHHAAWCDELAKWRHGNAAWDNLVMGLRLGERPRIVVTTTPAPVPLMRKVMALPDKVETVGRTWDNIHLPDSYFASMEADYGGTRLGRQELEGELLEDHEGALWTRAMLDAAAWSGASPAFRRVVVAVDPPASADGDACGIVCVALGEDGLGYVLEDASVAGASPGGWAAAVAACAARWGADRVVAEKNQGGDMVGHVLRGADAGLPVTLVYARDALTADEKATLDRAGACLAAATADLCAHAKAVAPGCVTPAHRGCAYAVFEGLQLADFGNRIPSLSFEVMADAGAVSTGAVARALAPEVAGGAALPLDGYAAAGGTVREALEGLAEASGAWFGLDGPSLVMRDEAASVVEVASDPARDARDVAAADRAPALASVRYFEPERDWQAGLQRARRSGEGPALAMELPAALSAAAAKGVAEAALRRGELARTRRTVGAPLDALTIQPGDAVTVAGEAGVWRVEAVTLEGMATALTLVPLAPAPMDAPASAGRRCRRRT